MGVVCFRYIPAKLSVVLNQFQQCLADRMFRDGFAALTTTVLRGMTVLRMCTINPRTTEADIDQTIARLGSWPGLQQRAKRGRRYNLSRSTNKCWGVRSRSA